MLRLMVSQPVYLGIKHPSGASDQILLLSDSSEFVCCAILSLTRGRVCCLRLLLALASAVILGSESHGTRDRILLFQIRDFPFRCLLRLTGLRWRYSTPPPHGMLTNLVAPVVLINRRHGPRTNTPCQKSTSIVARRFVAAETCLLSLCPETALVYPPISWVLHTNGCTLYSTEQ
jgi:hypothetical protein